MSISLLSWDTAVSPFFVTGATHKILSGCVLSGQDHLVLPMNMHIFGSCNGSFSVTCWMINYLQLISFFLSFPSSPASALVTLSCSRVHSLCSFLLLMWLLLQILHSVTSYLFSEFLDLPYHVVAHGLVLCTRHMLPCKTPGCCTKAA